MTRLPSALAFALLAGALAAAQPPKPADPPGDEKARELFRAGKFDDALKELQALGIWVKLGSTSDGDGTDGGNGTGEE